MIPRKGAFMPTTYIVSTARTPIGKFGGALKDVSPVDLGAHVMKAAVARAGIDAVIPGEGCGRSGSAPSGGS